MSTSPAAKMEDEGEKDTNGTSVATDNSNASTAAAPTQKPRFRIGAVDTDWLFSTQADNPLVTIKCGNGDKTFMVLKSILTRNSDFFENCLNKPWAESTSSTVHLPDIGPETMGLYLTLTTRQALMNVASKDHSLVQFADFLHQGYLPHYMHLYKACHYLQNKDLTQGVEKMICDFLSTHSTPATNDNWAVYFRVISKSFDILEHSRPAQRRLQRRIVKTFCARVPSEVYFIHCKILKERHAFSFEVKKQYALNAMWSNPVTRAAADKHKTQRMRVDDDSEAEG